MCIRNIATSGKGKVVIVTRHVERPRRIVATHHHHHHHNHVHYTVKREVIHYRRGADGKRFINRRAELLQYSQHLRESARPPALAPSLPLPNSSNNNQPPETKVVNVRRNSKNSTRTPTCLGNFFKLLSLQARKDRNKKTKSLTTGSRIKALTKSLQVQKRHGFLSKLFLTSRKKR
ncbi:hypothetical protein L484_023401 [Morus notabilis]|uniref:Uncharacterized protein n=1 Tax=Morus notabilis TaxID=981085 RepID=W9SU96_9ROSA|nr:hypothetical protein L484_023401 [Morus notabilis]